MGAMTKEFEYLVGARRAVPLRAMLFVGADPCVCPNDGGDTNVGADPCVCPNDGGDTKHGEHMGSPLRETFF